MVVAGTPTGTLRFHMASSIMIKAPERRKLQSMAHLIQESVTAYLAFQRVTHAN
jgi:hypothetical protein